MLTLSEERKFHLIFAQESESSRERKFLGTRVPGNESTRERKFHIRNMGTKVPVTSNINSEQFTSHINNFILQVLLFVQKAVKIMYHCFKFTSQVYVRK